MVYGGVFRLIDMSLFYGVLFFTEFFIFFLIFRSWFFFVTDDGGAPGEEKCAGIQFSAHQAHLHIKVASGVIRKAIDVGDCGSIRMMSNWRWAWSRLLLPSFTQFDYLPSFLEGLLGFTEFFFLDSTQVWTEFTELRPVLLGWVELLPSFTEFYYRSSFLEGLLGFYRVFFPDSTRNPILPSITGFSWTLSVFFYQVWMS